MLYALSLNLRVGSYHLLQLKRVNVQKHFYRQLNGGTFEPDFFTASAGPQNAGFRSGTHSGRAGSNDRFGIPDYRPVPFQIPHPGQEAADTIRPPPG